ncbi:hypothetical protein [Pedococcus sp. 5OH_020]|uniref:hypothetical protein n=1 Tax=Pedococcus sp. 5OH_020 TaxID=2989814 RepID=UPI0022E9F94F|nr:hypothetical protein [Pedococcus sp. 5OH_020]
MLPGTGSSSTSGAQVGLNSGTQARSAGVLASQAPAVSGNQTLAFTGTRTRLLVAAALLLMAMGVSLLLGSARVIRR